MPTTEEIQKALDGKFKGLEDKFIDLQAQLKTAQENGASKDEVTKLHDMIQTVGTQLTEMKEAQQAKVHETYIEKFTNFLTEKKDDIKKVFQQGQGFVEFKLTPEEIEKVPASITTGSGTDAVAFPATAHNNLGGFNFRDDSPLIGLAKVSNTNKPVYAYSELEPKDGDYTFVAEGAAKPQTDFKWVNRFAQPNKIAAYEVLTEESVDDVPRLQSVAREYLKSKHDLFKASAVYFADGTGGKPEGATVVGRVFSAGALALKIANPNIMDVINACITDIYTTQNYTDEAEYMANVVLLNPNDFFLKFVSAKDADGLPLYPQASLFKTVNIGGVEIRPWAKIPAGKIFVADMKQYHIINYIPFSIRIGWINDQFITNQFTMLGESRFYSFVKNLDRQAFIYDDIATIETAIKTI